MQGTANNTNFADDNKQDRLRDKLQVINTLILALATLAIKWCSYQSVLWNGIQTFKLADSNKFARLARQKTIVAGQNGAVDEAIVIAFVKAPSILCCTIMIMFSDNAKVALIPALF